MACSDPSVTAGAPPAALMRCIQALAHRSSGIGRMQAAAVIGSWVQLAVIMAMLLQMTSWGGGTATEIGSHMDLQARTLAGVEIR